jgi:copper oxidase (laccase) domain-containing protein
MLFESVAVASDTEIAIAPPSPTEPEIDDDRTVAVVHCGWRGLVADVVGALIDVLDRRGCGVQRAVLGPSVCGSCYPVPPERAAQVADHCGTTVSGAALVRCPDGQPGIDVAAGVIARLVERGVAPEVVHRAGGCTVEDSRLFSHRRDGVTGRHGMIVTMQADGDVN